MDLILYQFGSERCDPLHTCGPSKRNHYLFHYVLSGKGRLYPVNDYAGNSITHVIHEGEGFLKRILIIHGPICGLNLMV